MRRLGITPNLPAAPPIALQTWWGTQSRICGEISPSRTHRYAFCPCPIRARLVLCGTAWPRPMPSRGAPALHFLRCQVIASALRSVTQRHAAPLC